MTSTKDTKTKSAQGMQDDSPKKVAASPKPATKKSTQPAKDSTSSAKKTKQNKGTAMPEHGKTPRPPIDDLPTINSENAATHQTDSLLHSAGYHPTDEEAYMNKNQIIHFRTMLEGMRQQLMEDVDRTVNDMRNSDKNLSDYTDCATNEEEMFVMLRTSTREGKLLKKIEEALQRIEHHDYGFCDSCGIEIGFRRLEARPTATLCIDCKTLDEIREKQRNG